MSSPTKDTGVTDSVSNVANLNPYDSKLLLLGSLCINGSGKIDSEKLARLAKIKPNSAISNYGRARRRLINILGEEPESEGAGTKDGSTEATPTKPRAPKRRKTAVKAVPKDKIEEASDNEISVDSIKATPTKPRVPKRRKTVSKDEVEEASSNEVSEETTEPTVKKEIEV